MADERLMHPADRDTFRRRFCRAAESQFFGPLDPSVRDCSGLVRYAYRTAGPPSVLFRTGNGRSHFADAQHLREYNTWFVSREWRAARPGDLLFFLQLMADQPFHVMVYLGPSQLEALAGPLAVYHTGPSGRDPGEVRRPAVADLIRHPDPRWRPEPGNAAFLGVHQWRILA